MSPQQQGQAVGGGWSEGGWSEGGPEAEQKGQVGAHGVAGSATAQQTSPLSGSGAREQEQAANTDYIESKTAAQVGEAAKAALQRAYQSDLRTRAEAILRIAERETSHLHYEENAYEPSSLPVKLPSGIKLPFKSLGAIRRDFDIYCDYHRCKMRQKPALDRATDLAYHNNWPLESTGKIPSNWSQFSIVAERNLSRVFESHLRHLRRALWIREDEDDSAWQRVEDLFIHYTKMRTCKADDESGTWDEIMAYHQDVPLGLS